MRLQTSNVETVRVLSENEIQARLYGTYLAEGRKQVEDSTSGDSVWTGSKILEGEMERLRSQLLSLREEKEQLARQLVKIQEEHRVEVRPSVDSASAGGWFGRLLGVIFLAGALGYGLSVRMLQASPVGWEATPYTVQVAVYNGPVTAQRAEGFLKELGYDAFLVESPRSDGQARYRVYVGSFVTKEEAQLENNRLATDARFQDFKDAFVRVR